MIEYKQFIKKVNKKQFFIKDVGICFFDIKFTFLLLIGFLSLITLFNYL
jgi:hypothetical protein